MVHGGGNEWMDARSVLGVELQSLANGLDDGVRKREESKDDPLVWGLNNWEDWGEVYLQ